MIILRSLIVAEESKLVFIRVNFISRKLGLLGFALVGLAGHIGQEVLYPVCTINKPVQRIKRKGNLDPGRC